MRTWTTSFGMLALMGGLAGACNSGAGGVGAPCETKEDCEGALICDEHEGQASCQEPHGHGTGDTEHGHASSSGTEHGHDSGSGTEHGHDSSGTEHGHESGSATGTGSDASPSTDSGDDTTGGASAECEAYCGCLTMYCSEYDAYPHADEAACLAACNALPSETLTCFTGFCEDAAVERSASLREHYCEHAWGELGTDKC